MNDARPVADDARPAAFRRHVEPEAAVLYRMAPAPTRHRTDAEGPASATARPTPGPPPEPATSLASLPTPLRCLRDSRALRAHPDGEADELTARQVGARLDECRRCGMQAVTYRSIHRALRESGGLAGELALRRLHPITRSLGDTSADRAARRRVHLDREPSAS